MIANQTYKEIPFTRRGLMNLGRQFAVAAAAGICLHSLTALAEDKPADTPTAYRCISLRHVQSTTVVDDQTILFHMTGRRTLKMSLTYPCYSLKFYGFFSYTTHTGELCAKVDMVVSRDGSHCPIESITLYEPTPEKPPK